MSGNSTDLLEGLSLDLSNDSFLLNKYNKQPPPLAEVVFKKPKRKLFEKDPNIPYPTNTRKVAYLKLYNTSENSPTCSTAVDTNVENVDGVLKQQFTSRNSIISGNYESMKRPVNSSVRNMLSHLNSLSGKKKSKGNRISFGNTKTNNSRKQKSDILEKQTQAHVEPTLEKKCKTPKGDIIDKFLENFDTTVIPQFASIITISSDSEISKLQSTKRKQSPKKEFNSSVKTRLQEKRLISDSEVFDVEKRDDFKRKCTSMISSPNVKNINRKLFMDANHDKTNDLETSAIITNEIEVSNLHDSINKNMVEQIAFPKTIQSPRRENDKCHKPVPEIDSKTSTDSSQTFVKPKLKRSYKKNSQRKQSNVRRTTTIQTRSATNRQSNLKFCFTNRMSGFVNVLQNSSNDKDTENSSATTNRRERKPPKRFVQATYLSPRLLKQKANNTNDVNKPSTSNTAKKGRKTSKHNKAQVIDNTDQRKVKESNSTSDNKPSKFSTKSSKGKTKNKINKDTIIAEVNNKDCLNSLQISNDVQSNLDSNSNSTSSCAKHQSKILSNTKNSTISNYNLRSHVKKLPTKNISVQQAETFETDALLTSNNVITEIHKTSTDTLHGKLPSKTIRIDYEKEVSPKMIKFKKSEPKIVEDIQQVPIVAVNLKQSILENHERTLNNNNDDNVLQIESLHSRVSPKKTALPLENDDELVLSTCQEVATVSENITNDIINVRQSFMLINEQINNNSNISVRKSGIYGCIPEENNANMVVHCTELSKQPDLDDYWNNHELTEDVSTKNLFTIIDNKVTPLNWYANPPSWELESNKRVTIEYSLKNVKTHSGCSSYGYIAFAPGEKRVQTSMRYSLTYKVEKGHGSVLIQLQKVPLNVGCCFHIPLGSTYSISNSSETEPLILFFHKALVP